MAVSCYLDKALIQRKVVSYGVLPSSPVVLVEGVLGHDVAVDIIEGHFLIRRALDSH